MRTRRRTAVVAAVALLAAAGGGVAATTVLPAEPGGQPTRAEARGLGRSAPVRVVVPRLGVDAEVRTLSLTPDGELEVPPRATLAGWYAQGTSPGEPGSAVLIGHTRDFRGGPPIFADLDRLAPGDRITVVRADRTAARFSVERVAPYSPVDRGYRRVGVASLRLVPAYRAAVPPASPPGRPAQPVVFAVLDP